MFGRFTYQSRQVVAAARAEAQGLGHSSVVAEHLLLGLTEVGGSVAYAAISNLGIDLECLQQQVTEILGYGQRSAGTRIGFAACSKRAFELALRESVRFRHSYIGTEHLLLGLIRDGRNAVPQIFEGMGVDLVRARETVAYLLPPG